MIRGVGVGHANVLRALAGWSLILGLAYVPWHAGGAAPAAGGILAGIVMISLAFWLLSHVAARTRPAIPIACLVGVVVLLIQGWWMVINAHHRYDPIAGDVVPIQPLFPWLPGSMDASASRAAVINASSMLAIICIACDLGRRPRWRRRLWVSPVVIGASISLYGIVDRLWPGRFELFERTAREGSPFSTFNYHGTAGAFLNLCLPGAIGFAILTMRRRETTFGRIAAVAMLLTILCAVVLNASRAAHGIAVLLCAMTLGWWILRARLDPGKSFGPRKFLASAASVAIVCAAIGATAIVLNANRWARLPKQLSVKNPRLLMWRVCWHMLPEAGSAGYGPGTYKLIYPRAPQTLLRELYPRWIVKPHVPGQPVSIWSHVHNDYLQLIFEWGWFGGLVWISLLFGGIAGIMLGRRGSSGNSSDAVMTASIVIALAGVLIHAVIDFPLQTLSIQAHLGAYLGLSWASRRWERRQLHRRPIVIMAT